MQKQILENGNVLFTLSGKSALNYGKRLYAKRYQAAKILTRIENLDELLSYYFGIGSDWDRYCCLRDSKFFVPQYTPIVEGEPFPQYLHGYGIDFIADTYLSGDTSIRSKITLGYDNGNFEALSKYLDSDGLAKSRARMNKLYDKPRVAPIPEV